MKVLIAWHALTKRRISFKPQICVLHQNLIILKLKFEHHGLLLDLSTAGLDLFFTPKYHE